MNKITIQHVETLLRNRDFDTLVPACHADKQTWKAVQRSLYSTNEDILWPAIEISAMTVKHWWDEGKEEKVREYIRVLFWSLNDESGGIGWNAPQTIAEIIVLIPDLIDPYGSMMIDRTMEEPLLVPSSMWAIGRMGQRIKPAVSFFQELVLHHLTSDDPEILGLTAWAMGEVGFEPALPGLNELVGREELVSIYIRGDFHQKTVGDWTSLAIAKINSGSIS